MALGLPERFRSATGLRSIAFFYFYFFIFFLSVLRIGLQALESNFNKAVAPHATPLVPHCAMQFILIDFCFSSGRYR